MCQIRTFAGLLHQKWKIMVHYMFCTMKAQTDQKIIIIKWIANSVYHLTDLTRYMYSTWYYTVDLCGDHNNRLLLQHPSFNDLTQIFTACHN